MKCLIDGESLVIAEYNGVEIDDCPTWRGVWLGRGELEKIIERSVGPAPQMDPGRDDGDRKPCRSRAVSSLGEPFDF